MIRKFCSDHDDPQDSQLIVCLTGTPASIKDRLRRIIEEIDSSYGKPSQIQILSGDGRAEIITPIWNKRTY